MPTDQTQITHKAEDPIEEIASILAAGLIRRRARARKRLTGLKSQLTSPS